MHGKPCLTVDLQCLFCKHRLCTTEIRLFTTAYDINGLQHMCYDRYSFQDVDWIIWKIS